jgi:L-asparaginase II
MVAGAGRFDTHLMRATGGRVISKGGAEAFQIIGLMPGALGPGSPAVGIALKIADGDDRHLVRSGVALEVLRQLNALTEAELQALSEFGPCSLRFNWRKVRIGQAMPTFLLQRAGNGKSG